VRVSADRRGDFGPSLRRPESPYWSALRHEHANRLRRYKPSLLLLPKIRTGHVVNVARMNSRGERCRSRLMRMDVVVVIELGRKLAYEWGVRYRIDRDVMSLEDPDESFGHTLLWGLWRGVVFRSSPTAWPKSRLLRASVWATPHHARLVQMVRSCGFCTTLTPCGVKRTAASVASDARACRDGCDRRQGTLNRDPL
jgi:hypothetical protein